MVVTCLSASKRLVKLTSFPDRALQHVLWMAWHCQSPIRRSWKIIRTLPSYHQQQCFMVVFYSMISWNRLTLWESVLYISTNVMFNSTHKIILCKNQYYFFKMHHAKWYSTPSPQRVSIAFCLNNIHEHLLQIVYIGRMWEFSILLRILSQCLSNLKNLINSGLGVDE